MMTNGATTPLAIRKALIGPSGFKLLMLSRLMLRTMNNAVLNFINILGAAF